MKALMFRQDDTRIPSIDGIDIVNLPVFTPKCRETDLSFKGYDALAYTSTNAVECAGVPDWVNRVKVFSIGESTARALAMRGVNSLYPQKFTSRDLGLLMRKMGVKSVLALRSSLANEDLSLTLKPEVNLVENHVYDLVLNQEEIRRGLDLILNCGVDVVVLTSSLLARIFRGALERASCTKVVSIGPVTSKELKGLTYIEAFPHDLLGIKRILEGFRDGRY